MGEDRAGWEHGFCTRLTAIRLAAQMLDRDRGLSDRQRRMARTVVQAADDLVADLPASTNRGHTSSRRGRSDSERLMV
jgi:hypothetical protein